MLRGLCSGSARIHLALCPVALACELFPLRKNSEDGQEIDMYIPPSFGFLFVAVPLCLLALAMDYDYRKGQKERINERSKRSLPANKRPGPTQSHR